jgi:hypothetical protein
MNVVMAVDFNGTFDGEKIGPFKSGQKYDVTSSLGARFVNSSMAEPWVEPIPETDEVQDEDLEQ